MYHFRVWNLFRNGWSSGTVNQRSTLSFSHFVSFTLAHLFLKKRSQESSYRKLFTIRAAANANQIFFFFFLKKNINNPEHTFLMICFLRCLSLSEKMNFCIFCSFLMIFSCKSASLHVCFTILFTMPSVTKSGMLSHIHQTNAKKTFFLKWVLKGIKRSRQVAYFITIRLKPFQYLTAQCI